MKNQQADLLRSCMKCIVMDGTGQRDKEMLGMLVSATVDARTIDVRMQFLSMKALISKHGNVEAAALCGVFEERSWHLSTLLWIVGDSAATNFTAWDLVAKAKKEACLLSVEKGLLQKLAVDQFLNVPEQASQQSFPL
jgi:hypothetical protein